MSRHKYNVTFEFETLPPVTERGYAEGVSVRTIAARAVDDAIQKNPNMRWSSIVILIFKEGD